MTAGEAITQADSIKYNSFSSSQKLAWLEGIDKMILTTVLQLYPDAPAEHETFTSDTELYVPSPFDELYISWLFAKIDLGNNEYEKYNNDAVIFEAQLKDYKAWMIRNNVPKKKARIKRVSEV